MLIIPAIDILDGNLVRLEKGNYKSQKIYSENPFEISRIFSNHGFDLIHIVDLSGSKDGRINTIDLLKKIKSELKIKIQFGGGIRTLKDAQLLVDTGVDKIVIGSIAVSDKNEFEKIITNISLEKIISAIDAKDGIIRIKGWTKKTKVTVDQHIEYCISKGVKEFLCTDIDRDGMLSGLNIKLYETLKRKFPDTQIIASGGVSNLEDIKKLKSTSVYGVVIGKAIYENKINLKELAKFVN